MANVLPAEIARAIAARRKIEPRTCQVCGTVVPGLAIRRYCSGTCRQRASYVRNADRERAERRERYRRQKQQQRDTAPRRPRSRG